MLISAVISFGASVIGAICGIGGGILGRSVNGRIASKTVDKLFIGLMALIILICVINAIRFSSFA